MEFYISLYKTSTPLKYSYINASEISTVKNILSQDSKFSIKDLEPCKVNINHHPFIYPPLSSSLDLVILKNSLAKRIAIIYTNIHMIYIIYHIVRSSPKTEPSEKLLCVTHQLIILLVTLWQIQLLGNRRSTRKCSDGGHISLA